MRPQCYQLVLCLLMLLIAGIAFSLSGWCDTDVRPIIVIRSDDIRSSWRTSFPEFGGMSALEYGKLKRIPITWGIITNQADSGAGLTWSEIKDYLDTAGGEAASHSVSHIAMNSTQAYIDELVNSKAIIDARLGPTYTCRTFLQPGVWTGDANCDSFAKLENAIGQAIQSTYAQSMAYLGTAWRVGHTRYPYGTSNLYVIDYTPSLTWLDVQAMLDVAVNTPGLIMVIACHGIQASNGTQKYSVPANIMASLMNRLAELRNAGIIRLMSLNEAFNTPIPEYLNRIPNPAFEIYTEGYSDPCVPWYLLNATLLGTQGRNASRCARLSNWNSKIQTGWMLIEPGLYELTWYQKRIDSPPNSALKLEGTNYGTPYETTVVRTAYYPKYCNDSHNTWEQKSALLLIKDKLLRAVVAFQPTSGVFLVDDVCLVKKSVDPNVCPSNISIVPNPTGGTIYWDTPNNASVRTINCRYGSATHPISLNDGTSLGTVNAIPGSRQQLSFEINWQEPNLYGIYCSIFATGDAWCSDPNVEYLIVDKTPPQVTANVSPLQGGSAIASWSVAEDRSSVYQVQYAVGFTYGSDDIINWTVANGKEVTLTNLPTNKQLFFSIKAQNAFGFWSSPLTVTFRCQSPLSIISDALASPDGTYVTVSGYVTAIFKNESYIEDALRVNAIKLIGSIEESEGEFVTVSGTITTVCGERAIILEGHN